MSLVISVCSWMVFGLKALTITTGREVLFLGLSHYWTCRNACTNFVSTIFAWMVLLYGQVRNVSAIDSWKQI